MTVREILEKLANDFDVDKNELWRTTGGRIIIDQAKASLAEEVGRLTRRCECPATEEDCFCGHAVSSRKRRI